MYQQGIGTGSSGVSSVAFTIFSGTNESSPRPKNGSAQLYSLVLYCRMGFLFKSEM